MDCREVRARLREGLGGPDAETLAHLETCPACAELWAGPRPLGAALGQADRAPRPDELEAILASVERGLEGERAPLGRLRALSTRARSLLVIVASAIAVALSLLKPRPDLGGYSRLRLALELGTFFSAIGLLLAGWLRPLHRRPLPRWLERSALGLALLGPALVLPLGAWLGAAIAVEPLDAGTIRAALPCFLRALAFGAPVVALAYLLGRGGRRDAGHLLAPVLLGTLAGLASLHLHCPGRELFHLLLGHAGAIPAAAVAGLLAFAIGRRRRGTRAA